MTGLANELDNAIAEAVKGLRGRGYSWAEIGPRLGITRQAAQQRWGAWDVSPAKRVSELPQAAISQKGSACAGAAGPDSRSGPGFRTGR